MDYMIYVINISAGIYHLIRLVWLKLKYEKHDAICLEYTTGMIASMLYQYEMEVDGKKVTYKNWGWTYYCPPKGWRCKVLVNKNGYNKVVGSSECIADILLCVIIVLYFVIKLYYGLPII